jgi:hypothetical protein
MKNLIVTGGSVARHLSNILLNWVCCTDGHDFIGITEVQLHGCNRGFAKCRSIRIQSIAFCKAQSVQSLYGGYLPPDREIRRKSTMIGWYKWPNP